ncbi:unnamed protein product, partial [Meganyctiphanes norvegica]
NKYKIVCDKNMKLALTEYTNGMKEKMLKGHKKPLPVHSKVKTDDAIELYKKESSSITEPYLSIVEEYLELLKKDIDKVYQELKKEDDESLQKKSAIDKFN